MKVLYVDFPGQYRIQRKSLLSAIDRTLAKGHYVLGEEVEGFERRLARLCGVAEAVAMANGTDALLLTFKALGIGPGDEVVTVANSFISSVSSIVLAGAKPVFADVKPDQLMSPESLERALTKRTKAVVPVHLTGKVCDMWQILRTAKKRGLLVVEDAAQAVGAKYHGRPAGSFGRAACFSFHPLKNLNALGDAGAVVTRDAALARRLRLLRNHGLVSRDKVSLWGHNSRMDAVQAAVLNVRLKALSGVIRARRRNAALYRKGLADVVELPNDAPGCFDTYHLFVVQCERRDALKRYLKSHGVSTAIHYPTPAHRQPVCRSLGCRKGSLPEVERQSGRILSLPVHQGLSARQIGYVIARIRTFYGRR